MNSAVLFIIFKRPDTTQRVFERIREAQPPRLYIAADGPRKEIPDEKEKCEATRKIVENIDWSCDVHRLYLDENHGCGKGPCSAITWFFEHEEQGIIIEDDILPHLDFFRYCDEMLDRYKDDLRIQSISGHNTLYGENNKKAFSYFISPLFGVWGWASWRRVWNTYEYDVNRLSWPKVRKNILKQMPLTAFYRLRNIFRKMAHDKPDDIWDYQFQFNQIQYERYSIFPYINMTKNIGFDTPDATHTMNPKSLEIYNEERSPYPLCHPEVLQVDEQAFRIMLINDGLCYETKKELLRAVYRKILRILHIA